MDNLMSIYRQVIFPTWKRAIENKSVSLNKSNYTMEQELYSLIMDKDMFNQPYQFPPLYLQYLALKDNDPQVVNYAVTRSKVMLHWGNANHLAGFVNAINYNNNLNAEIDTSSDLLSALEQKKQLLRRIYIYQAIIASWTTLEKIQDKQALRELSTILDCQKS